jgi:LacI family transcriptional regulator
MIPMSDQHNTHWSEHQHGIDKAIAEISQFGVSFESFAYDQHDVQSFAAQREKIVNSNIDGILLVPFYYVESMALLQHCHEKKIPCVFIDTHLQSNDYPALSFVGQHAFRSGYFAGSLFSYWVQKQSKVLVVSINAAKMADNHVNYLQREEGFKAFMKEHPSYEATFLNFNSSDNKYVQQVESELARLLKDQHPFEGIFVTNSRASIVAAALEKINVHNLRIVGYDLTESNKTLLTKGSIDFLISQNPARQSYLGIQTLFRKLILNENPNPEQYMPLDLIHRDNLEFYLAQV